uniref:Distal membrane arm assembly component 2 like n=1 Tax=Macaca fascicularis TaxID=9541 RepID=I7GEG0_MACFA|nr:unnamed protein product [Macaca fascicularis]
MYLVETCAHAGRKPWSLCDSRTRAPLGFRERGLQETDIPGALADRPCDLSPSAGMRMLELKATTAILKSSWSHTTVYRVAGNLQDNLWETMGSFLHL